MIITDCHIHIQPVEMFKAGPLEVMKKARGRYDDVLEYCRSPKALLKYLDSIGVERAVLINYVAPETMGFTHEVNEWVANYCKEDPRRLALLWQRASPALAQRSGRYGFAGAPGHSAHQDPSAASVALCQ